MKKLVLIIVLLAVCGAAVWLGTRAKPAASLPDGPDATSGITTNAAVGDAVTPAPDDTAKTPRAFRHRQHSQPGEPDPMDVWDKEIDAVLTSKAPDIEIADKLLKMYPQLPTNSQADLFMEITPRVSDENYSKLANVLTNSTTPEDVLDTLLTDLIDRPDKIRMPVLLDLMRTKDNPKSEDAHDLLEVILGDDYGEDWDTWSKKISEWMTAHPE